MKDEDELKEIEEIVEEEVQPEEAPVEDAEEQPDPEASEEEQPEEAVEDVLTVSLDEEPEEEPESAPIRTLRQQNRDLKKKLKEFEAAAPKVELGEKPTLEACDFDQERFETELLAWSAKKLEVEAEQEAEAKRRQDAEAEYQERLLAYSAAKKSLPVKDFDGAEEALRESFSDVQQSILVANAKRPEVLVYALGKNDKKASELAKETDPIKFAYALAQMEASMKVAKNRKPAPEPSVKGGASAPAVGDKKLAQLRKKAQETGDFTELTEYKRKLRAAS